MKARGAVALLLGAGASLASVAACLGSDPSPTAPRDTPDSAMTDAPAPTGDAADAGTVADTGVPPNPEVASLAVGGDHACVLRKDSRVFCWGSNAKHQLGANGVPPGPIEVTFPAATPPIVPVSVVAGASFTCVQDNAQRAWCWGDNALGQLGNGATDTPPQGSPTPTRVVTTGGAPVAARPGGPTLSATSQSQHACLVAPDGALLCWGWNRTKQLGYAAGNSNGIAQRASGLPPITSAAAATTSTCVIEKSTGTPRVGCWGRDLEKFLDDINGSPTDSDTPTYPVLAGEPRLLRAGATHVCALDANGKMSCWGSNTAGQLGPTTIPACTGACQGSGPYVDPDFASDHIVDLAAGYRFTCVVLDTGGVFCLGVNSASQLSGITTRDLDPHSTRVKVRTIDDAIAIGAGSTHVCVLRKTGGPKNGPSPWCWGDNTLDQLGNPTAGEQSTLAGSTARVTSFDPVQIKLPE